MARKGDLAEKKIKTKLIVGCAPIFTFLIIMSKIEVQDGRGPSSPIS